MRIHLFFVVFLVALSRLSYAQERSSVHLGAIVSLSGDAAHNGEDWLRGARFAVEEAEREGTGIQLSVEDDGTNPKSAAAAFAKLVSIQKVQGVIGGTWDFLAETLFPLAKQYRTPFITPTNPIEIFSDSALHNKWVYTNGLALQSAVDAAAHFLVGKHITSIGLITIDVPYGQKHRDLLKQAMVAEHIAVAFERTVTFAGFVDDIKRAALETRTRKPDAVFIVLNYAGVDQFLREISGMEKPPMALMTHTLLEAATLGGFSSRYGNSFGIYQQMHDRDFAQRFEKRWGVTATGYAANGYDATRCLARALQASRKSAEPPEDFICEGVTGTHRFNRESRSLVSSVAEIMRVQNKTLVRVE